MNEHGHIAPYTCTIHPTNSTGSSTVSPGQRWGYTPTCCLDHGYWKNSSAECFLLLPEPQNIRRNKNTNVWSKAIHWRWNGDLWTIFTFICMYDECDVCVFMYVYTHVNIHACGCVCTCVYMGIVVRSQCLFWSLSPGFWGRVSLWAGSWPMQLGWPVISGDCLCPPPPQCWSCGSMPCLV